eukprot:TRINITY_DN1174_c0_g1_i1.p2 TRINITY_DN1174_c0_g1~~TRINITY_DN1174_c0_g1_i1.p2  ORF type:complete len:126 (-),score=19.59 TRINITY_DN1174_c0_g1_i1:475-852(-)
MSDVENPSTSQLENDDAEEVDDAEEDDGVLAPPVPSRAARKKKRAPAPERTTRNVNPISCNPKVFAIFICAVFCIILGVALSLIGETTVVYFGISFLGLGALSIVFASFLARCWAKQAGRNPNEF